jgi:hypothetical protein
MELESAWAEAHPTQLIVVKGSRNVVVAEVGFALMLYGSINLVTLVRNATGLVKLYGTFRRELRRTQAEVLQKPGRDREKIGDCC